VIRPLNPETDAPGVVELIHEVFPSGVTTVESWRQQQASIPPRARHASWVAIVGGTVAARADASLNWFSDSRSAFAGVSVGQAFRGRGIGGSLWKLIQDHLDELKPSRVLSMFVETPEGAAFARARGFEEVRAETLSCVDPRTVDLTPLESASIQLVPLRNVSPEEVYEVDMITTADVPMTDEVSDLPFDEWLDFIWRRPTMTLDGSFAAIEDDRVVCITMLAANLERGRAFNEYTGTLPAYRGRGLADLVKRASLRWAAENGIGAVWTTNDETNAPMLAVNGRLGYTPRLRRVEYLRDG
jgi:GNAT superfamily N-acetyltransferase